MISKNLNKQNADNDNATILSNVKTFDVRNIIFSAPNIGKIPDSEMSYKRVFISAKNADKSIGDLVISTPEVFSYGPSENINQTTKATDGYKMPLCLFSKTGATEDEKDFVDFFNKICDKCKDYVVENREELECYDIESKSDLKKLNPLYYKKEKGKIVENVGPTLYAKLIVSKPKFNKDKTLKEPEKIVTSFYNMRSGEKLDPFSLMNKYCYTKAAIKFESLYFGGGKVVLQVKLYECLVRSINGGGLKRLFELPESVSQVVDESELNQNTQNNSGSLFQSLMIEDDKSETGSIQDEEEETMTIEPEPELPKRIVKKGAKPKKVLA